MKKGCTDRKIAAAAAWIEALGVASSAPRRAALEELAVGTQARAVVAAAGREA
jgi:hypothetical protein